MASGDPGLGRARGVLAVAAAVALVAAAPARANLFAPGPLARAHASLEGLTKCTQCHVAGKQLSQERCLACHVELKERVAKGQGFHGRIPTEKRDCETCHREHQGTAAPLVDWGPGGRDRFDHARTGTPLRGKHAKATCGRCHEPRLVADPVVRTMLDQQPQRVTFLGSPTACASCHFDEHRGQVSTDCKRCHDDLGFKPAKGFDHAKTAFRLVGKHQKVDCLKCHPKRDDAATPATAFPAPKARSFSLWKPIPHERCIECHKKDPHLGKFGESCQDCHVPASWKELHGKGKERAFHQKTKYPLEGAHLEAECKACHGPYRKGEKAKFKGLAFKACTDCHADAHVGQLAKVGRPAPGCDACHGVAGWLPPRFELEQHARSRYPLAGAHVAVSCGACHPRDERLPQRMPGAVRARLEAQHRPVKVSTIVLARNGTERCETCHRDPHGGQFRHRTAQPSACLACHVAASWSQLAFDHGRDSRFPLTGKHAKAACVSCHPTPEGAPTRYRPLELACAGCHADPHAGQLRAKGGASDCARCHETAGWKAPAPLKFVHAPPFTPFVLRGKHAKAKCEACHRPSVVAGATTARYKPLPSTCEGCHADFHKGAFRGFVP